MRRFLFRNLRIRLIVLLTVAIAPAIALATYDLFKEYRAANTWVEQEKFRLAQAGEAEYQRVIENSHQLILALSHIPGQIQEAVTEALLPDLKIHYPYIAEILIANRKGDIIFSDPPQSVSANVAGAGWFQQAVQKNHLTIGEFLRDVPGISGKVGIAESVHDKSGELRGVICVCLNLRWLAQVAARVRLPENWVLTLTDRNGTVLMRYPEGHKYLGNLVPEDLLLEPVRDRTHRGETQTTGADGVERVYSFTNLVRNLPDEFLYLSVGAPASIAGNARRNFIICLLALFIAMLLAFLGMIVGSQVFILDKLDTLIRATRRLCAGDLSVRTGLSYYGGELGQLAAAFDQMAETLELQEIVRKRSQAALYENEQRFRAIFDWVNDAILVHNSTTGAILDVNQRMCELFRYSREEALRMNIADLGSGETPYTLTEGMEWLRKAVEEGPQVFEWHAKNSEGRLFWSEVSVRGASIGGRKRALVTIRDITERKKAEIALRNSEARYRAFIVNSSEGVFRLEFNDPVPAALPVDDQIARMFGSAWLAECNDMMAQIYGQNRAEDILGKKLRDLLPNSDPRNHDYLRSFIQSGYRLVDTEVQHSDSKGNNICLSVSLIGVVENGMLVRAWGVQRDITQQKQAEEKLRFLNQFNQEIISSARNGIIVYDPGLNHVVWNRAMEELTGLAAEEVIGRNALDLFPHVRETGIDRLIGKALKGQSCRSKDTHFIVAQTGKEVWMIASYGPHYDPDGNIIGVIGIVTDITYRKHAEQELERLSRQKQLILDAAGEAIIGLDLDGKIVFVNPASALMLGHDSEEILGSDLHDLIHHSLPDGSPNPRETCLTHITSKTGVPSCAKEEFFWRKDGTGFPAVCSSTPIIEAGEITGTVTTFRDISEQKKAEELRAKLESQLRQAQKMEAIGTLAGGIAHDFNNILTPIMGYCQLALAETSKSSGVHRMIQQVLQSSFRAKSLVKQILAFSRKGEQERKPVQVNFIIKETLNFLRSSLPSTIDIRREIDPEAAFGSVMADPTQIHQIMMNLCANAAHAIGEKGGTLKVALSLTELHDEGELSEIASGPYLKLSVTDTGCGMDDTVMQRIFEPYFTTKGASEGTGLGLAVVYGIVRNLGGTISVSSTPGRGTAFTILLPKAEMGEMSIAEQSSTLGGGHGRILLVDDEKMVVDVQKEALEHMGYEVVARHSSLDALEAFRANPWRFDLVLTDQTMPQMTGIELAKEILKIRSDIPIVLCTGLIDSAYKERALEAGIRALVVKPLVLKELSDVLQKVLEQAGNEIKEKVS